MVGSEIQSEMGTGADREKLLLVDDDRAEVETLTGMLRGHDYEIVTATSGAEALGHLRSEDFAVALLDLSILGTDGSEIAASIRDHVEARGISVIVLSRETLDPIALARAYGIGAIDCLAVPPDAHTLIAKIEILVGISRRNHALVRQIQQDEARATSQRRERDLLQAHLELKRRTIDEAPIGIGFASLDGRWIHGNHTLAEIVGMPASELVTVSLHDLVHRDDEPALRSAIRAVVSGTEDRHRGEYRLVRRDGTVIWTSITLSLLDKAGTPTQLTIVEDISERKQLALALQESEMRFARLQESGLLAVAHEDEAGIITHANDAFLDLVGYTREELSSRSIEARGLTPAEGDAAVTRAAAELHARGVCRTYERQLVRKDGRRVSVLVGAVAVDRPPSGVDLFALDISQRKMIELERTRLVQELEDSVRRRDEFLSLAAHELRHPLTPLLVQVTSLRGLASEETTAFPRELLEWLDRQLAPVERSVRRLQTLVEILLDVSRLTVGRFRPELHEIDLSALVRETIDKMRFEITRTGSPVTVRAERPIVGRSDRSSLGQVVTSLMSNALRYGSGQPIEVETDATEDWARLSIIDHGGGIAVEDQVRISARFERAAPLRHFGGFGLGLWVVNQIVAAHEGRLQLWSQPGEGSRFTIELPLAPRATTRPRP